MNKKRMFNAFKNRVTNSLIFPNISTIAYYDGFSQLIYFNTIERNNINTDDNRKMNEITKIMAHETQHWVDHVSTLWGQDNLIKIYNAIESLYGNNAKDFWMLRSLWKETQNSKLVKYYTIINEKYKNINAYPWQWQLSAGLKFNSEGDLCSDRPIIFTRFSTLNGKLICRVPFTIEALLETSAMSTEFEVDSTYFDGLTEDFIAIESQLLKKESLEWLYNVEMTPYSVAAHFLSNSIKNEDIISTFMLSKKIATLCLNIPGECFDELKIPCSFGLWKDKNKSFIKQRDKGYLYTVLIENIKESYKDDSIDYNKIDINEILSISGLPKADELEKMCIRELSRIRDKIKGKMYTSMLVDKLDIGLNLHKKRGICGESYSTLKLMKDHKSIFPYIYADDIFDDDKQISIWIDCIRNFEKNMKEFNSICGI
ncbi:hypothetical protein [Clostridium sp.]|uniref:hypothetical protein n=1 Tax=Clostridium sp. TaxID=1506 RepID=UPI002FDE41D7